MPEAPTRSFMPGDLVWLNGEEATEATNVGTFRADLFGGSDRPFDGPEEWTTEAMRTARRFADGEVPASVVACSPDHGEPGDWYGGNFDGPFTWILLIGYPPSQTQPVPSRWLKPLP